MKPSACSETSGVAIPKRAAEQLVREAAVDFEAFYTQRPGAHIKPARGEVLIAAIDCKGIPDCQTRALCASCAAQRDRRPTRKRMATVATRPQPADPAIRTPQQVRDRLCETARRSRRRLASRWRRRCRGDPGAVALEVCGHLVR
jgi:hypothetical protein